MILNSVCRKRPFLMEYRNLRPILPTVAQIKSVRPHTHHQFWFQQTDWCENGDVLTTGEICETKDLFDIIQHTAYRQSTQINWLSYHLNLPSNVVLVVLLLFQLLLKLCSKNILLVHFLIPFNPLYIVKKMCVTIKLVLSIYKGNIFSKIFFLRDVSNLFLKSLISVSFQ